jgi:hypothetical protein
MTVWGCEHEFTCTQSTDLTRTNGSPIFTDQPASLGATIFTSACRPSLLALCALPARITHGRDSLTGIGRQARTVLCCDPLASP